MLSNDQRAVLETEMDWRQAELSSIASRRLQLVNELNELAAKVDYSPNDYDSAVYWDNYFSRIANNAEVGYAGHRPDRRYTFWLPSVDNC